MISFTDSNANQIFLTLFICCALSVAQAETPSYGNQPISIEADSATQDKQQGVITYSGNVTISQVDVAITADQVKIYRYNPDNLSLIHI